jgi:hypothetical protein
MSWSPDALTLNAQAATEATQFVNALSGSTVNVTLSDPYMTGASWAVLFDSAAAYTNESLAAANHIILPQCGPGQVSTKEKPCRPATDSPVEDPELRTGQFARFAHILVIFYYEVAGVTFSLETYFRLRRFNISHGKTYPKVTMSGVDPQTVTFNQNLANYQMKENVTLEENLKEIANNLGYRVSFCNSPGANYSKPYIIPTNFREKAVTGEEVLRKYIASVGGSYSKLPTKEYANKISVCTRANVNQGCSVFYLGKGLYEGYQISGGVERDFLNSNYQTQLKRGLGIDYDTSPLNAKEYTIEDSFPEKRKAKLKGAKTSLKELPEQFTVLDKRLSNTLTSTGFVWRGEGPVVSNTKVENTNLYGIGANNNTPISFLDGIVENVSKTSGTVSIQTNYVFKVCEKLGTGENKKCTIRPVFQEVINMATVEESLARSGMVEKNQVLGTATAEKKWFTRFYIPDSGSGTTFVTLSPSLVWNFAIPVLDLTDEEKKDAGAKIIEQSPESSAPSPPQLAGKFIGRIGNTGRSTAPHLHAEFEPKGPITASDLDGIITIGGRSPSSWVTTSVFGAQESFRTSPHGGVDIAGDGIDNQPIELINGKVIDVGFEGGFGNYVVVETPRGVIVLAHLSEGSTEGVSGTSASGTSTSSKYGQGTQNSPAPVGVEVTTEFKGIPRALRIVPGRTILSFVTQYDKWLDEGRPANIDPGVWIPERFSRWFVKSAEYRWSQGDLRVKLTGVSDWGVAVARRDAYFSPSFQDYLKTENFKYSNYYGYIRSLGDLCWTLPGGKTSCDELCKEAEELREFLQRSREAAQSGSVSNSFPPGDYSYTGEYAKSSKSTIENTISALKSLGITNPIAYSGVLGNFSTESNFNSNVHNGPNPGRGCGSTPSRVLGTTGYGIAQWCGSRADNLAAKCGRNCSEQQQLEFMVQEIREERDVPPINGVKLVDAMNSATTPQQAADLWNRYFERGPGGIQKRRDEAVRIWNDGQNFRKN